MLNASKGKAWTDRQDRKKLTHKHTHINTHTRTSETLHTWIRER